METSCLMSAFRVASWAHSNYEGVEFQDSFSVLLESNGWYLCSCKFFCQYRFPCQHAMKVMLATTSPAIVHSVAARWLIRSIHQHLPHGLQAAGEIVARSAHCPVVVAFHCSMSRHWAASRRKTATGRFRSAPSSTIMQKAESLWRL